MEKLKQLVIHTSDTPFGREVTPDDIVLWHKGAKNNGKSYTFLGKKYKSLDGLYLELPSGKKVLAKNTNGRGWRSLGYSDMIQLDGEIKNLTPYNFDDEVDSWEITNGASGYNSISRHIVLAGGWSKDGIKNGHVGGDLKNRYFKISDLYTAKQIESLVKWIKFQLQMQPDLKVVGHNDLSSKTCPNFLVKEFLKDYDVL